jgi:hypothetical protein
LFHLGADFGAQEKAKSITALKQQIERLTESKKPVLPKHSPLYFHADLDPGFFYNAKRANKVRAAYQKKNEKEKP